MLSNISTYDQPLGRRRRTAWPRVRRLPPRPQCEHVAGGNGCRLQPGINTMFHLSPLNLTNLKINLLTWLPPALHPGTNPRKGRDQILQSSVADP